MKARQDVRWYNFPWGPFPEGRRPAIRAPGAIAILFSLLLASLPADAAPARKISGTRDFSGEVVVPKGETWEVLPGAEVRFRGGRWVVRGRLLVEGTEERPVRIGGDDAFDGIDLRGEEGARFSHAVFRGGRRGVQVTGARAEFTAVRFEGNGIGVDVGQYARAVLSGCVFDGNGRVGVLVRRGGSADISGSRFLGAGKAGVSVYGADNVALRDCRFERNAAGVHAAMAGARAQVGSSVFRENATGVLAERMAAPNVVRCELVANDVGLLFRRRAEGSVSGCRIEENGTGVLVEFSSYPSIRGNTFRRNRELAVRLRHQSAEWEEEATLADREGEASAGAPFGAAAEARGDFRPRGNGSAAPSSGGPPDRKTGLSGTVDFRGNDWGELQHQVDRGGNISGIHDGRTEPYFEYKGKKYRMDRVLLK